MSKIFEVSQRATSTVQQLGLVFGGTGGSTTPVVDVDADWAGDHETRKSMSGYVAMKGGAEERKLSDAA